MSCNRRFVLEALSCVGTALALPQIARAKDSVAKVAWLVFSPGAETGPREAAVDGFREGLRKKGWVAGRNLTVLIRSGGREDVERLSNELAALGVDVIFTDGALMGGLLKFPSTTPIVFTASADPVEAKWVDSIARPGGRVTG